MNKHIALVLGIIFSLTILFVPFTGAFASSDSSVALPQFVFSLMFQSVTTPTFVDVTNYNAATDTTSSASSVSLANSVGSYSQINRTGIPVAQNLICIKFSVVNPTAHFFDDITIEPYINGSPAHLYGTYTLSDSNNQIDYYMFFYIGEDSHRVKDGSGQDITPWGIRITTHAVRDYSWSYSSSSTSFYYYNYTLQSQTIDPGEAAELALDIINVLQLSQLSENLGMINTQLDTGNIASMLESMLTYLADIPDILNVLDSIDNTDNNILYAINDFITYYENQLDYSYISYNITNNNTFLRNNNSFISAGIASNPVLQDFYIQFNIPSDISSDGTFNFNFRFNSTNYNVSSYHVEYTFTNISLSDMTPYQVGLLSFDQSATDIHIFDCFRSDQVYRFKLCFFSVPYTYINNWSQIDTNIYIVLHLTFDNSAQFYGGYSFRYYFKEASNFQWNIIYYLKQLVSGGTSTVPSNMASTTNDINQNATTVNDFQSNTQQSLDQNLNDIPVVDYQIQATTGTQYMKAYSEALFNASNGFRIWYMLPLILFVIGMLIRWGVKK